MQRTKWHIRQGNGAGGFLCPPGHPNLIYSVEQGPKNNPRAIMALDSAIHDEWVSTDIRFRAEGILRRAQLRESEGWLRMVYGYFRHMYVPESGSRNTTDLIVDKSLSLPAERCAAVACIRKYFPDHQPREDLIGAASRSEERLYGSYPCVYCGERVKYEARQDAYVIFNRPYEPCGQAPDANHTWFTAATN